MFVDGLIGGRAQVDVLANIVQCIHGVAGSKKIPSYKDITGPVYDYIDPPKDDNGESMMRSLLVYTNAPPEVIKAMFPGDQ